MIVPNGKQTEGGYVLVTVAAMLVILIGFTALAIDTGVLYADRTQSQRAADAAALAGAFTFVADTKSSQPATAEAHARAAALKNTVMGVPINSAEVDVCVGDASTGSCNPDTSLKRVKVTITRQEPTFFAKILGASWVTTRVEATAEASNAPTSAICLKPFFIPNTAFLPVPDPSNPPNQCTACGSGNVLVDVNTNSKTPFAQGLIDNSTSFTLKPQDPQDALTSSQFYLLDLTSNSGQTNKNGYKENIKTCLITSTICRDSYNVIPGNTVGPTRDGVSTLIDADKNSGVGADTYFGVGQYGYPDGTIHDTSKALVVAPIWDSCATILPDGITRFCPDPNNPSAPNVNGQFPPGGSNSHVPPLSIIGFALVFIDSVDKDEGVHVHLIDVMACGPDISDPDGSSAFSVPVRLIRPIE